MSQLSTLTDSKGSLLAVSDKVRDEEGFTWWVLSMFPEINSVVGITTNEDCLLYTSPSPRDKRQSRMPSSA